MSPPWSTRPALGTWVKIPAPEIIEVLASTGLQFVVIDDEHATIGKNTISTMIAIARGCGIEPFVRVAGYEPRDVVPILDAGAAGLFIPHVDSVSAAGTAVSSCRFPPEGTRGASPSGRAGAWGRAGLSSYLAQGRTAVTIVAQLESPVALVDAADIAGVAGIDAAFFGPVDLAVSSELSPEDGRLKDMVAGAEAACTAAGMAFGTVAASSSEAAQLLQRGHRFVVLRSDVALLASAAAELVSAITHPAPQPSPDPAVTALAVAGDDLG